MSTQVAARAILAVLVVCVALAATARAGTSATITPSLHPDQPGAEGALVFTISFAGGELGVPSPVRHTVLRFPAGLDVEIPELRGCTAARLRSHGAGGCPPQSEIGQGYALAEARAGSQIITENIALWAFLGPVRGSQPTIEILGRGYTPFDERMVSTGRVISDRAPYGEDLVMSIPPIPTLSLEPDASIVTLSLTIGASKPHRAHDANTVIVPPKCPAGGFPFAAEFTYADGSSDSALATVSCSR